VLALKREQGTAYGRWSASRVSNTTHHQHTGEEPPKVDIRRVIFWRELIGPGAAITDRVGHRSKDERQG
jgi:hypothetical protein